MDARIIISWIAVLASLIVATLVFQLARVDVTAVEVVMIGLLIYIAFWCTGIGTSK